MFFLPAELACLRQRICACRPETTLTAQNPGSDSPRQEKHIQSTFGLFDEHEMFCFLFDGKEEDVGGEEE
jgi:hypothetical protein